MNIDFIRESLKNISNNNVIHLLADIVLKNLKDIRNFDENDMFYKDDLVYLYNETEQKHMIYTCKADVTTGPFNIAEWDSYNVSSGSSTGGGSTGGGGGLLTMDEKDVTISGETSEVVFGDSDLSIGRDGVIVVNNSVLSFTKGVDYIIQGTGETARIVSLKGPWAPPMTFKFIIFKNMGDPTVLKTIILESAYTALVDGEVACPINQPRFNAETDTLLVNNSIRGVLGFNKDYRIGVSDNTKVELLTFSLNAGEVLNYFVLKNVPTSMPNSLNEDVLAEDLRLKINEAYNKAIGANAYTDQKIAEAVGAAPEQLNTLNELSAALNNDGNFATNIINQINAKASSESLQNLQTEYNNNLKVLQSTPVSDMLQNIISNISTDNNDKLLQVGLKGRTVINLLGNAGNFESIGNWYNDATVSLSSSRVFGENSLKLTTDAENWCSVWADITNIYDKAKYYCASIYAKVATGDNIRLRINDGVASEISSSSTNTTKFVRIFVKYPANYFTGPNIYFNPILSGASGSIGYIDGAMLNEITEAEYNDASYIPPEYVNSDVSTKNITIKSVGKNLINIDNYVLTPSANLQRQYISNGFKLKITNATTATSQLRNIIKLKPNTQYTLKYNVQRQRTATKSGEVRIYSFTSLQSDGFNINNYFEINTTLWTADGPQEVHFTTNDDVNYAICFFAHYGSSGTSAEVDFTFVQLEEGDVATGYEPYKESTINIPYELKEVNGISDEITQENKLIQKNKYTKLDGNLLWYLNSGGRKTGYCVVRVDGILSDIVDASLLKYNNKPCAVNDTISNADIFDWLNGSGILFIGISNIDSGWGDTYTPTTNEIKAYFNGWRMGTDVGAVYEGVGNKYWFKMIGQGNIAASVCPTTSYIEFTPYRLYYQLVTPIVRYIGPLSLTAFNHGAMIIDSEVLPIVNYTTLDNTLSNINKITEMINKSLNDLNKQVNQIKDIGISNFIQFKENNAIKIGLQGRTIVNLMGPINKVENITDTFITGGTATMTLDASTKLLGNNSIKVTGVGSTAYIRCDLLAKFPEMFENDKFYVVSAYAKTSKDIAINIETNSTVPVNAVSHFSTTGKWNRRWLKISGSEILSGATFIYLDFQSYAAYTNAESFYIDGIMVNEISRKDFDNPTYQPPEYVEYDGYVSNPSIKVIGKNMFNPDICAFNTVNGERTEDKTRIGNKSGIIPAKPNTAYTISLSSPMKIMYSEFVSQKGPILDATWSGTTLTSLTIVTSPETHYINFALKKSDDSAIDILDVIQIQLEEGFDATEYEPYRETNINLPYSLMNFNDITDEITTDGKLIKRAGYKVLDGNLTYTFGLSYNPDGKPHYKYIYTENIQDIFTHPIDSYETEKHLLLDYKQRRYKNKVSFSSEGHTLTYNIGSTNPNRLAFTLLNSDTGWGDNYTPTAEEIKAYFYGWVMCDASQWNTTLVPYNGTGTKGWAKRWVGIGEKSPGSSIGDIVYGSGSLVCPAVVNDGGWNPYKIYYQLNKPSIKELQIPQIPSDINVAIDSIIAPYTTYELIESTGAKVDTLIRDSSKSINLLNIKLDNYNSFLSSKDTNGIFTIIEYKRKDGTLYMRSVLSEGTSPSYTKDTWTFYDRGGVAVIDKITWKLTYDTDGDLISKEMI